MTGTDSGDYFLGHSDAEIERLAQQSAFYRDATEALLKSAGLGPGMRVLDIGSGAGCPCSRLRWLALPALCWGSTALSPR
jgi:hypothetical protein